MTNPAPAHPSIAACNDDLRRNLYNPGKHRVQLTTALTALIGDKSQWLNFRREKRILRAVYDFTFPSEDRTARDLGYFELDGHQFFFRIAAFDNALSLRSSDPANEQITTRVLTIMLAHEY